MVEHQGASNEKKCHEGDAIHSRYDWVHPRLEASHFDVALEVPACYVGETGDFIRFLGEGLDNAHAGEVFLRGGAQL